MKPVRTPQAAPEAPVRVEFQVRFSGGPRGRRRTQDETATIASARKIAPSAPAKSHAPAPTKEASLGSIPKITKLLVLGHHFENLVRDGAVKDYAEIARLTGLSRARVTQIAGLTLLTPEIQEAILEAEVSPGEWDDLTERDLRPLATDPDWPDQAKVWAILTRRPSRCSRASTPVSSSRPAGLMHRHLNNTV